MEKSTYRFKSVQVQRVFDNAVQLLTGNNDASIHAATVQVISAAGFYERILLDYDRVFSMLVQAVKN